MSRNEIDLDLDDSAPAPWQGNATCHTEGGASEPRTYVSVMLAGDHGFADQRRIGLVMYGPRWNYLANVTMDAAEARRIAKHLLDYADRYDRGSDSDEG